MSAHQIICAVIPEREDDGLSAKFLVVAPEDRIVWIATTRPGQVPDHSPESRKKAVTQAGLHSLIDKLKRQDNTSDESGDILELTDMQIDCRDRNQGKCSRFPLSTRIKHDCQEGAVETDNLEDCYPGVLECWMLEEDMD